MAVRQGLAVLVLLIAGGTVYFLSDADSAPASRGQTGFVNASIDLGRHFWKAEVPFELEFVNHSPSAVDIAEIKSSCDCTVIDKEKFPTQSVAPGATLSIPGTLHAGTRPGEKKRTITLVSASGATFTAELHIEVAPSYTLSRGVVKFAVLDDEPVVEEVRFESDVSQMIGQPISDSPWLTAETDGDLIRLTVDPSLVPPTGRSMAHVSIQTHDVHVPVVTLPVAVSKLSDINVYPPRLFVIDDTPKRVLVTDAAGSPTLQTGFVYVAGRQAVRCLILATSLVLSQSRSVIHEGRERPEALRLFEEARKAIVFADVLYSTSFPSARDAVDREPWFHRAMIARDDVVDISVGTASGVAGFSADNEPQYRAPTAVLEKADGTRWWYDLDKTNVQLKRPGDGFLYADSFRSLGMSFRPSMKYRPEEAIVRSIPNGKVIYRESVVNGIRRVEATEKDSGKSVVWFIDPRLGWNATRCELWQNGDLIRASETEYKLINDVHVPIACAYMAGADGAVMKLVTVESADVNSPDLPRTLTPEYIGVEPGMTVSAKGTRPQKYIRDGRTVSSREAFNMEERGEIVFGPKVQASRAGRPIPWSIPEPKKLKKELEAYRKQIRHGPLGPWEKYTLDFIAEHKMDEAQRDRAIHVLRSCTLQRDHYLRVKGDDLKRLETKRDAGRGDERKKAAAEITRIRAPVERIFENRLKPRLAALLTAKQREAARTRAAPSTRPTASKP